MKSYLEKNNIRYFNFSPNSEKPIKAIIRHLPPGTPAEHIPSSLEDLGFNIIKVRQMMANRRAPWRSLHGNPTSIPGYLNNKLKITRDIQDE
jgi:hypothetical protein